MIYFQDRNMDKDEWLDGWEGGEVPAEKRYVDVIVVHPQYGAIIHSMILSDDEKEDEKHLTELAYLYASDVEKTERAN